MRESSDLGGLRCGGVVCLAGSVGLLGEEARLVHEQVGAVRGLDDGRRRCRIPGDDDAPAGTGLAENLGGAHRAAVRQLDILPSLQPAARRAGRDTELVRLRDVKAARPLRLDERVPERGDTVVGGERLDRVVAARDRLSRLELDETDRIRQAADEGLESLEELAEATRAVDGEGRLLSAAEREGLEHARQPEEVVGVVMGEEDLLEIREPDGRALELALRAFSAVEEEPLTAPAHEDGRRAALCRRRGRSGAEEDDVEIHSPILGGVSSNPDFRAIFGGMDARGRWMQRTDGLGRSITLLRAFLLASALILVVGGAVLGWALSRTLWQQAVASERSSLVRYVDGVVRPALVHGNRVVVNRRGGRAMLDSLRSQRQDVVAVKVWEPDGRLAWTNIDRMRIGHRFPLEGPLETAIDDNSVSASFVSTSNASEEDDFEASLGFPSLLQVYAPIIGSRSGKVIGAYEIYANPAAVIQLIGARREMIWFTVAAVFLTLWAALALLVRSGSRRLVESNRLLERSALEAVASLNETVDAKDPYTAGHSLRVQRIAVEIGREMGLGPASLETLRYAGLFHDIGKIGVPDAILTKPDLLTEDEFEVVKRHPEDGARIVGRLHSLEATVPAILHHHERWDGAGYPHALRGDEIPAEASIVGLADAFDAMTTDRPYSDARPLTEAVEEIVRNRGTQFAPAAVDAFLRVAQRMPEHLATQARFPELVLA